MNRLSRWATGRSRVRAASLDVALDRLPDPETRVAFGLDRPALLLGAFRLGEARPRRGSRCST